MKLFILFPVALLFLSTSTKCREYHYEKPPTPFLANMGVQRIYSPPQAVNGGNYNAPRTVNKIVRTYGPAGKDYAVQMSRSNEIFEGHQAAQQQIGGGSGGDVTQGYLPPLQVQTQQQIQASGGQYHSQVGVSGSGNLQHSTNVNPLTQTTHYSQTQVQTNQGSYAGTTYAGASYSGSNQPGAAFTGATYAGPSQAGPSYAGISQQGAGTSYSGTSQPSVAYTGPAQPASYPAISQPGVAYNGAAQSAAYPATNQPGVAYTSPVQPVSYPGTSQSGVAYSGAVQSAAYPAPNQPGVAYSSPVQPAAYPGASHSGVAYNGAVQSAAYPAPNQPGVAYTSPVQPAAYGDASYASAPHANTGLAYSGATSASASYSGSSYSTIPQSGGNSQYNPSTYAQTSSNTNSNLVGGQFGDTGSAPGKLGDYVSQSEAAALDYYTHKQENGDTRPFARHITTCSQSGKCDQLTLPPGQPDAAHQQTILAARARIAPVSDKCQRIAQAKSAASTAANAYAGGSYYRHSGSPLNTEGLATGPSGVATHSSHASSAASASTGQRVQPGASGANRPHDRRLFEYSEVEIPQDPYN